MAVQMINKNIQSDNDVYSTHFLATGIQFKHPSYYIGIDPYIVDVKPTVVAKSNKPVITSI